MYDLAGNTAYVYLSENEIANPYYTLKQYYGGDLLIKGKLGVILREQEEYDYGKVQVCFGEAVRQISAEADVIYATTGFQEHDVRAIWK